MSVKVIEQETSKLRRTEAEREQMTRELNELERKQKSIIQEISDRAMQGSLRRLRSTIRSIKSSCSVLPWQGRLTL